MSQILACSFVCGDGYGYWVSEGVADPFKCREDDMEETVISLHPGSKGRAGYGCLYSSFPTILHHTATSMDSKSRNSFS